MSIDLNDAIKRALDQAAVTSGQDRESLLITDTLFPNQHPGVDLDGWALFTIAENFPAGKQFLVGVHMESGESKDWEDTEESS